MKALLSTALLLVCVGTVAQGGQLGVLSYQPPAEAWTSSPGKDHAAYTLVDRQRRSFAQFAVYASRSGSGDGAKEFEAEWLDLVEKQGKVARRPVPVVRSAGEGWQVWQGEARVTGTAGQYTCWLTVYVGGGQVASVLANYNDSAHLPELQKLVAAVRPITPAAGGIPASTTAAAGATGPAAAGTPKSASVKKELWMGLKAGAWNQSASGGFFDLAKTKAEWKVVYPDGDYYPDLPREGLLAFDRDRSKADAEEGAAWGRFTFSGGRGRFLSRFEDVQVEAAGATVLKKSGSVFNLYKSADVTGLTLQGSWSSIPGSESDPYYGEPGCRPVIYFDPAGRFDDRGIFVSDCRFPEKYPEDAPGIGRYRIQEFTLVLEYAGGRRRYAAFSGLLDRNPATADQVLYIGGNPTFKRSN